MEYLGYGVRTHKARHALGAIAGALLLIGAHTASAQTPPASNSDNAPSEAARRAAASPYRFILQNATAPARKPAPAPAPTAIAEPKKTTPAPAPVQQAAARPAAAAPAPASAVETPPPEPAPEPPVAALTRKPVEPPQPKRAIIPITTDEPRLPAIVMRENPNGTVRVHFDIQPDGSVGDVKIMSSTTRSLTRPTSDAVSRWKFEPVDEILTVETEIVYKFDN